MLVQGKRPRELHWYHAGPMLFGDWGTSRLYVLGLCFVHTRHASLWFMLAMSVLLLAVGWAYQIICRLYPDGGGVYSSARHRSEILAMIGGLLLCADYVVTAALSAVDAFHYVQLPVPHLWAAGSILLVGFVNWFGPRKSGSAALVIALLTVAMTLVIVLFAVPSLGQVHVDPPADRPIQWWMHFTYIILAISGVEAVANMTGIMVKPVEKTARRSIVPVMLEIVILNLVLTLAMQAVPYQQMVQWGQENAELVAHRNGKTVEQLTPEERAILPYEAHRDDMLHALADYYVGPVFAMIASVVFALLLLSAVNTAVTDLVSIQFMMSRDRELPLHFSGLNNWGMPVLPLLVGTVIPFLVVLAVPDVGHLADLYAIGVVGAVAINLGTCSTNFHLEMKWWERGGMLALGVLMVLIWLTIAYEKPGALAFALTFVVAGLGARWVVQNREPIKVWLTKMVPTPVPEEGLAPAEVAPLEKAPAGASYTPTSRILVATRGNPKLIRFALEQARSRQAELLVLFIRHLAVMAMGSADRPDVTLDREAQKMFAEVQAAADQVGVPMKQLYAVSEDVAETILDFTVTYGADLLILGTTQRGALWRTMKGDVIQGVAKYLPEQTNMLIHA